jgi:hypothetical protein
MYDLDAINADQLVTATDRALRGNLEKLRAAAFLHGSRYSARAHHVIARAESAICEADEPTLFVRQPASMRPFYALCAAAVITWLCVGLACLLA